jgi:predicted aminopeptidase
MIVRLLLVLCLSACSSPAYYLQAMSGQNKLMQSRQDIQSILDDPATSAELAAQLETAGQIKVFAQNELHLPVEDSYSSYVEVEGDALVWNVIATREFSLEAKKWCFPVAGCVPYRGYFERQKAQEFAKRLSGKGMDVIVSPAAAYSSLGWFEDPLLSTMLSGTDTRLAAYLFHELAHQRLYVKHDGEFNEGYASFVEDTGVRSWLVSRRQPDELQNWLKLKQVSEDFSGLVKKTRRQLGDLYRSEQAEDIMRRKKSEILATFESDYRHLSDEKWEGRRYYANWFEEPLNNARLALYNTYEGSHCAFKRLWDRGGGDWQKFHQLAEQKSRLPKEKRTEWLRQPCTENTTRVNL